MQQKLGRGRVTWSVLASAGGETPPLRLIKRAGGTLLFHRLFLFQPRTGAIKSPPYLPPASGGIQFHNGSIKSGVKLHEQAELDAFQFHNGSIKRPCAVGWRHRRICFNSTMVRLKGYGGSAAGAIQTSFNSTMVRLKVIVIQSTGNIRICFNSTMVRLKEPRPYWWG